MDTKQKERIISLRAENTSYAAIAEKLGLSVNTIMSFCRRNRIMGSAVCEHCGVLLKPSPQKSRRFCSGACRSAWWNAHPKRQGHIITRSLTCAQCGKSFVVHTNRPRIYCSRKCYGRSKSAAMTQVKMHAEAAAK